MHPAIVVLAYNRSQALNRLLSSVGQASYPPELVINLVIAIDPGKDGIDAQVEQVAEQFEWKHGEKVIICQEYHLGLVKHFFFAGNLTQKYGSIILLEDDLAVSRVYYHFAMQALSYYSTGAGSADPIAGISLYSLWFNGYTQYPFSPLTDESDIFYLQVPYTQGQVFSAAHWSEFTQWLSASDRRLVPEDRIHEMFLHFDSEDWFPIRTKYLIESGKYYVFPREAVATGFGDVGTHFSTHSSFFQVPLQRFKSDYRFKAWHDSLAVYDSFFEILPDRLNRLTDTFLGYSYAVDLNGTKSRENLQKEQLSEYVLTSRPGKRALKTFGKAAWPLEANVIDNVPGSEIQFCKKEDLDWGWLAELHLQKSQDDFFKRRRVLGRKKRLLFYLLDLLERLGLGQT